MIYVVTCVIPYEDRVISHVLEGPEGLEECVKDIFSGVDECNTELRILSVKYGVPLTDKEKYLEEYEKNREKRRAILETLAKKYHVPKKLGWSDGNGKLFYREQDITYYYLISMGCKEVTFAEITT